MKQVYRQAHRKTKAANMGKSPKKKALRISRQRRISATPAKGKIRKHQAPVFKVKQDGGYHRKLYISKWHQSTAAVMSSSGGPELVSAMQKLLQLPFQEIVIVAQGAWEVEQSVAAGWPEHVKVIPFNDEEDTNGERARAAGIMHTSSEFVLLLHDEVPLTAGSFMEFLQTAAKGADVVLYDISSGIGNFSAWSPGAKMQTFLNCSLNRYDLMANSLSVLPAVLSRRAIDWLGQQKLEVPSDAHAALLSGGWKVVACAGKGKSRTTNTDSIMHKSSLSIEQFMAVMNQMMNASGNGSRLSFPDRSRKRAEISLSPEPE